MIGPHYPPELKKVYKIVASFEIGYNWFLYEGEKNYEELYSTYQNSDIGIFASSCENMPNILLEMMASGLPIACSELGPMPEILGKNGLYFNPYEPKSIKNVLRDLIMKDDLRLLLSKDAYKSSKNYDWGRCARQTFKFLKNVQKRHLM